MPGPSPLPPPAPSLRYPLPAPVAARLQWAVQEELPTPPRRCRCGAAIGDGDWASGHRSCWLHRSGRGGRGRR